MPDRVFHWSPIVSPLNKSLFPEQEIDKAELTIKETEKPAMAGKLYCLLGCTGTKHFPVMYSVQCCSYTMSGS